ncbi:MULTISPECIES: DUF3078 domain-containing protein [Nonlabens]|uniref:DUF3078 domain-containing protein n=1 Tax=Nonlabens TaxID=363408 RepID=UPI000CF48BCE|nr:DUF3078 domain-containing protein [Nonlabens tegetincola]PQJ20337.1 hypothetical protein BST93_02525 [Nonlabens tegetincola]
MKKILLLLAVLGTSFTAIAQDDDAPKEGWSKGGNFQALFNQSAFNAEWTGGGTSNISLNLGVNYDLNYLKGRTTWDNKIIAEYGITKLDNQEFTRKTNDRIELNSVYGYKIKEESNWSYSAFLNFLSQWTTGYRFGEDVDGNETRTEFTKFLSPGYLSFGPGILYRKSDDLQVNIAPATARFIFVDDAFTSVPGYVDGDYFGVDAGDSSRFEFGASLNGIYNFTIAENITMSNVLALYSNYLENPGNIDINYSANVNMKVNEWLSANLIFQAIYDDNAVGAFQVREVFGLGLNYKL